MSSLAISAVVPVYNAEQYIGQCLTGILSQTRPPDEVIVVDDGSSDGTAEELARFGNEIRVVKQANRGHPGAYTRCFEEARGDYVAKCDADDIWEPAKLERQLAAVQTHPEIDIAFCAAQSFGLHEDAFGPDPDAGLHRGGDFARQLYRGNFVCSPSTLIRRQLFHRLGPFVERLPCEDYDYWLRALKAGAVFFYDPAVLVRYRRHESNVTNGALAMHEAESLVHRWHADLVDNPALVEKVLAHDFCNIGRALNRQRRREEARAAFVTSLRHRPTPRALAWVAVLSTPQRYSDGLIRLKRNLSPG